MKRYIRTECGIFDCDGLAIIHDPSIRLPEGKLGYFRKDGCMAIVLGRLTEKEESKHADDR